MTLISGVVRSPIRGLTSPKGVGAPAPVPLIWFDNTDLSTMFQDRGGEAATTPVTAAGQSVGSQRNKGSLGGWRIATSDGARPTLQTVSGKNVLRFSSSRMTFATAVPGPSHYVYAAKYTSGVYMMDGSAVNSRQALFGYTGVFGTINMVGPGRDPTQGGAAINTNVNLMLMASMSGCGGLNFGTDHGGNTGASYDDCELRVFDILPLASRNTAVAAVVARTGAVTTLSWPIVVCDGNSITIGYGVSTDQAWPTLLDTALTGHTVYNLGVNGQTTADMLADFSAQIETLAYYADATSALIGWEATNDIHGGASLATCQARWIEYFSRANAAGWNGGRKRIAATIIARNWGDGGAKEAVALAFNTWLRANYSTYATHLVDLRADSRLADYADTTYFQADGIHPKAAGHVVIKDLIQAGAFT